MVDVLSIGCLGIDSQRLTLRFLATGFEKLLATEEKGERKGGKKSERESFVRQGLQSIILTPFPSTFSTRITTLTTPRNRMSDL